MFIVKTLENLDYFLITNPLLHSPPKTVVFPLVGFHVKEEKSIAVLYSASSCFLRVSLTHFLASGP